MTDTGLNRLAQDLARTDVALDRIIDDNMLWRCRVELALLYLEEGRVALAAELLREGLE